MRISGAILIALSSVFTGFALSSRIHERVRMLISVNLLIQQMSRSLSFGMTPYMELFTECTDERIKPFTEAVCKNIRAGADPTEGVRAGADIPAMKRLLTADERAYLAQVLSAVPQADIDGARSILDGAAARFGAIIARAEQSEKSDSKISMTAAVYIGAAAAVLLL
ncbi:MAG: hypothetical protein IIZ59_02335 [Clostridia bacterium]|nr:hypothetical protein [Clostridia bacterium]